MVLWYQPWALVDLLAEWQVERVECLPNLHHTIFPHHTHPLPSFFPCLLIWPICLLAGGFLAPLSLLYARGTGTWTGGQMKAVVEEWVQRLGPMGAAPASATSL